MSFWEFKLKVLEYAGMAGCSNAARFSSHEGKHTAHCDGVLITGNLSSPKLTVRWGSGHMAMV